MEKNEVKKQKKQQREEALQNIPIISTLEALEEALDNVPGVTNKQKRHLEYRLLDNNLN